MSIPVTKMLTIGLLPSPIKKIYYRFRGAKIGKGVSFAPLSIIDSKHIEIGDDVKIGLLTFITARSVKIGNRAEIRSMVAIDTGIFNIGADSIIMEQIVIGGMMTPRSSITIGKRVKVFPYSFLNTTEPIVIEDEVGIGGSNYIFTHGTWPSALDGFPFSFGPVTIKKGVWLPWRVFVLPNVTIGENSIIAAGSVLTKNVPDNCLAGGMPAKNLREDGSYIKQMQSGEKEQLIYKILNEFHEFLEYQGVPTEITESAEGVDVFLPKTNVSYRKSSESYVNKTAKPVILISHARISEKIRSEITSAGGSWFDIEAHETDLHRDEGWKKVREFLGRYGIRFNVINES